VSMYGLCCNKHVNDLFVVVFEASKFDFRYSRNVAAPPFVHCNVFASIGRSLHYRIHTFQYKVLFFLKHFMYIYINSMV
jgi:hypothetical protein